MTASIHCESPVFALGDGVVSYLVDITPGRVRTGETSTPCAFRLESIVRLFNSDGANANRTPYAELQEALIEPTRTYLDDVTSGDPGRGGRPLLFAAEPADKGFEPRIAEFLRPHRWSYRAEGRTVEMQATGHCRADPVALRFRDMFCAFESGHLFYVLSLFERDPGRPCGLDEYTLIALERLAFEQAQEEFGRDWRFAYAGETGLTLPALVERRLSRLAVSGSANGWRDVVSPILKVTSVPAISQKNIVSALVAINDPTILEYAEAAADLAEDFAFAARDDDRLVAIATAADRSFHGKADERAGARPYLALSGIVQSVPDFPYQDPSELYDSTRPVFRGKRFAIYAHPRFLTAIGTDWRSLLDCRRSLGTCPYLGLMWMVAVHDEMIVAAIEEAADVLIYGDDEAALRAEPLKDIGSALDAIASWRSPVEELRANLIARFELFRRFSINRSQYLFRYPKEKSALAAIEVAMGTRDRFERAHALLDRLENLVEDVHALNAVYSGQRMGRMVAILTVLGVITVYTQLLDSGQQLMSDSWEKKAGLAVLVLALVVIVFWREVRSLWRR